MVGSAASERPESSSQRPDSQRSDELHDGSSRRSDDAYDAKSGGVELELAGPTDGPAGGDALAQLLTLRASALIALRRFDQALYDAETAAALASSGSARLAARAYLRIGLALGALGRRSEALERGYRPAPSNSI
mgnify:CR=1 FL=1